MSVALIVSACGPALVPSSAAAETSGTLPVRQCEEAVLDFAYLYGLPGPVAR